MSTTDQTLTDTAETAPELIDEISVLKSRARMLGVEFSNNIGLETLRERVRAKIEGDAHSQEKTTPKPLVDPDNPVKPEMTLRQRIIAENMKLVRVRITNLDPKKKDLPGEIFTVANEYLGTVRKYIPYGEVTDGGYHIPWCIYMNLKDRKFLNIRSFKDRHNGNQMRIEQSWATEFAFDILPPLTTDELKKLAAAQLAAGGN